jgi:hypothetical protein
MLSWSWHIYHRPGSTSWYHGPCHHGPGIYITGLSPPLASHRVLNYSSATFSFTPL